jgi:hypothetical protein
MSDDLPIPQSALESFPDYVNAIGMITIEMGGLEAAVCQLFCAILDVAEPAGGSLFFSPRTTAGRLDMVVNFAERVLPDHVFDQVEELIKRAERLLQKRNDVVHEIWGIAPDKKTVMRIPLPHGNPKPVSLQSLTNQIEALRVLSSEIDQLTRALR